MRDAVAKQLKAGQSADPHLARLAELLKAINLRPIEGAGLEMSVAIPKLVSYYVSDIDCTPDEKKNADYKKPIDAIQARGIMINKSLSIKEVVAGYISE